MLKMKATTSLVRLVSTYQHGGRHIKIYSNLVSQVVRKLFSFILKTWPKEKCIHISHTNIVGDMVCCWFGYVASRFGSFTRYGG